MSLLIHLPLNGNLNNLGLSTITFSTLSNNTSINTSGKIGLCYNNNSNTAGGLVSNNTIDLGINLSMFCWVNFTSLMSNSSLGGSMVSLLRYGNNTGMGLTIKYVSSTTGYLSVNTGTGSARTYNTYTATTLMQAGNWYHVGYTYDGSNIRLYVNGVLEKTLVFTGMSVPSDYITIFCWSLNSSKTGGIHDNFKLNGKINDVRIYNHTLSPKEVKEISKGLVAHYKLDDVIDNITYDCSGYGHNGTTIGTLSLNNDSPRYNKCSVFNGTNAAIRLPQTIKVKDEISICCWRLFSSNGDTNISCTEGGGFGLWSNGGAATYYIGTGTSSNKYLIGSTSDIDANWHHIVGTYDGFCAKLYVDGVLKSTSSTVYTTKTPIYYHATNGIFIGAEAGSSATTPASGYFGGKMSDVRIYATALLADDVKELYNTSAFITDNGMVEGYEFVEEDVDVGITKTGLVKCDMLYESDSNQSNDITITGTGASHKPGTGNNSCSSNGFVVYRSANAVAKKYIIELDFTWYGPWGWNSNGTSSIGWNSSARVAGESSFTWVSNNISSALQSKVNPKTLIDASPSGGTYHYKTTFNLDLDKDAWTLRIRSNYSDGNGSYEFRNLKVYPYESQLDTEQAKIGDSYITSNEFIEI